MEYPTKRFEEPCHGRFKLSSDLYRIHSRNSNELGQSARQSRDPVFAIKLALVTVLSATIITQNFAPATDTIQTLVHYHTIAFAQIRNRAAGLLDNAGDLVSENLRLQSKRNRLSVFIRVVVCMPGEDVYVSSAETDSSNADQHFVR